MSSLLSYTPVKEIPSIVQKLRDQFDTGLTKDFEFRKQQLQNVLRFFEENAAIIDKTLYDDLHKHKMEGRIGEVAPVVDECKYLIKNLEKLAEPKYTKKRFKMHASAKVYVRKEPKGVVLVIGAWNYPVHLLLLPVVGAIAAGNCVVLKPSEVAERTADLMARVLPQYLDKRAYAVVNGGPEETTILLEEKFDHIFYTGNSTVGKIVMAAAAKNLTPITLELGGKSPAIITSSADIDIAAHRLLWGKLYNNGQTCVAPDYVLVVKEKANELLAAICRTLREFYGNSPKDSNSYGRIINARHFDRLKRVLDNIDKNKIVVGGETDRDSLFIAPTIVSPVEPDDPHLMREEIFGPILPIVPVEDLDEAVKLIKARDHPLAMYIFSTNSAEYNYILDKTNSGGTLVNDTLVHLLELSLPFGGVGGSGMGSYHGEKSFETFTHERAMMVKSNAMESIMKSRYPPYNDDKEKLMSLLVFGLPPTATAKVKAIAGLFGSAWRVITTNSTSNNQSKL